MPFFFHLFKGRSLTPPPPDYENMFVQHAEVKSSSVRSVRTARWIRADGFSR